MTVIGYIRVSTDQQDLEKQKHLLLEYSQQHRLIIDEFIEVEISSRKNQGERRITELVNKLIAGDILLVAELSRLGRNMVETLNLITELHERGIKVTFIRQPELSTTGPHGKLLLAIYSYFAEAEREFISIRTKQALAAARARGKTLGRPKGQGNKHRPLNPHREQIKIWLQQGISIAAIRRLLNDDLEKPLSYSAYKYFVRQDEELRRLVK
jgi:DNA invertase Pin-like site-specific DNA recombinase